MASPILEARAVGKRFGQRVALDSVSLSLSPGDSFVLFGPNGAGKTTLLKILAGLSRPSAGEVSLFGKTPRDPEARAKIGALGHGGWLHDAMTCEENLRYYGALYRLPARALAERMEAVLAEVGLADRRHDRASTLSRGLRQRLAIARAVLHDPPLLLLDEPFSGLDRAAARALGEFLTRLASGGRTLLAVTHEVDVSLDLATRVGVLSAGKLVLDRAAKGLDRSSFEPLYLSLVDPAARRSPAA